jgi:hypothetical protein
MQRLAILKEEGRESTLRFPNGVMSATHNGNSVFEKLTSIT